MDRYSTSDVKTSFLRYRISGNFHVRIFLRISKIVLFREYKSCEFTPYFHLQLLPFDHTLNTFSHRTLVDSGPKGPGRGKGSSFFIYLKRAMWLLLVLLFICYTHNWVICATICHAHNCEKLTRNIFTMELNSRNSQKFSNVNVSQYTVRATQHEVLELDDCSSIDDSSGSLETSPTSLASSVVSPMEKEVKRCCFFGQFTWHISQGAIFHNVL